MFVAHVKSLRAVSRVRRHLHPFLSASILAIYSRGGVGDDACSKVESMPHWRRDFMRREFVMATAAVVFTLFGYASLRAQQTSAPSGVASSTAKQTETDEYTRYELLAPQTASFKIYYEVTATTPGAKFFYNPIRKGSAASDEAVFDSMTGAPLPFEVVNGTEARKDPLMADADADTNFIKISLARPVP
jgi:hypothetical protein